MRNLLKISSLLLTLSCSCSKEEPPAVEKPEPIQQTKVQNVETVTPEKAETKEENSLKFQLRIDNRAENLLTMPVVLFTDENISHTTTKLDENVATLETPAGSLAELCGGNNKISWRPKWYFYGTGKVLISDIETSFDKSVLAVVEQFGTEHGPFGSRIVLINTYNWQTLSVHTFKDLKIENIEFFGDNEMYCYAESQKSLKQNEKLFKYDLLTKKIRDEKQEKVEDMVSTFSGGLFVKRADSNRLYSISNDGNKFSFQTINSQGVLGTDGADLLLFAGNKTLDFFTPGTTRPTRSIPVDSAPTSVQPLGSRESVMFTTESGEVISVINGRKDTITKSANSTIYYNELADQIVIEKVLNNTLQFYSRENYELESSVSHSKERPKAKGKALFVDYLPQHDQYLVVEMYGDFITLVKNRKKWKKAVVLSPEK